MYCVPGIEYGYPRLLFVVLRVQLPRWADKSGLLHFRCLRKAEDRPKYELSELAYVNA